MFKTLTRRKRDHALEIKNPGNWTVHLKGTGVFVSPSDALLAGLERIFGRKVCELR